MFLFFFNKNIIPINKAKIWGGVVGVPVDNKIVTPIIEDTEVLAKPVDNDPTEPPKAVAIKKEDTSTTFQPIRLVAPSIKGDIKLIYKTPTIIVNPITIPKIFSPVIIPQKVNPKREKTLLVDWDVKEKTIDKKNKPETNIDFLSILVLSICLYKTIDPNIVIKAPDIVASSGINDRIEKTPIIMNPIFSKKSFFLRPR